MKESKVCKRYKGFCNSNYKEAVPFPITVSKLVSYIKYRGRSLSTFHEHLIGLDKHPKHGPEWIRQVRNDPEVVKHIDQIDNRIRANNRNHRSLRSKWNMEVRHDDLETVKANGLLYGRNGVVCTEVKGPKNKGFRVVIPPTAPPQQQPTPYTPPSLSSQPSATQTPSLASPSSSSSSFSSPKQPQQHAQMRNMNVSVRIDDEDFGDVWYDDSFDEEYQQQQKEYQQQQQQIQQKQKEYHQQQQQIQQKQKEDQQQQQQIQKEQPDTLSDISFGDDEEFENSILSQINSSADNRKNYSMLDNYDFDTLMFSHNNVDTIPDDQNDIGYDFDFDLDTQPVQNDDDDDGTVAFNTYVDRINHSDDENMDDTLSDYSPFIYITQRYLRPKKKVQAVQQVVESPPPVYYSQEQINTLSINEDYEPVILIKANKKRKSRFLFADEVQKQELSDEDSFIDDSIEGAMGPYDVDMVIIDDEEEEEEESSKGKERKDAKGVSVLKERNESIITDEAIALDDSADEQEEKKDDYTASPEMRDRLKKSSIFQVYKNQMARKRL